MSLRFGVVLETPPTWVHSSSLEMTQVFSSASHRPLVLTSRFLLSPDEFIALEALLDMPNRPQKTTVFKKPRPPRIKYQPCSTCGFMVAKQGPLRFWCKHCQSKPPKRTVTEEFNKIAKMAKQQALSELY